jgi:signal transduction histidine kinase/ligand-binding sensor domain-containing protein
MAVPLQTFSIGAESEPRANIALATVLVTALFLFYANRSAALDPASRISQYGHTAWRVQDGYFGGVVKSIAQTQDGYIWVGTGGGLFKFDGVQVVPVRAQNAEKLTSTWIGALLTARDGSLWIGTDGDLFRLVGDRATPYFKNEGWLVGDILEDRDGKIWVDRLRPSDRTHPLCQVGDAQVRCYGKDDGIEPGGGGYLAQDSSGDLWIGGTTALVRFGPGTPQTYRPQALRSNENIGGVEALAPAPDGSLWVGMAAGPEGGLEHMVNGALQPFVAPGFNGESVEVLALCIDHQNNLWVGTHAGIYKIHGTDVDHYGTADGLSGDNVYKIFEDREGSIWAGTAGGLDMFRELPVKAYSRADGLAEGGVESVAAAPDGDVWIGTSHLQFLGAGGVSPAPGAPLPGHQAASLFVDHGGRLWAGMANKLYVLEDGQFREITRQDGQPFGLAMGITEDAARNIWVESAQPAPGTLLEIQDLKITQQFPPPAVPLARKIVADPHGGIWLGLVSGDLAHYQDGQVTKVAFDGHPDSRVLAITATPDGAILGGTAFGVVGWKDGIHQILTTSNGLPCNNVTGLIADHAGDLWLLEQCGLVKIPKDQMQLWWTHADSKLSLKVFDVFDGVQTGPGHFNTAAKTPDGRLWFANGNVLEVIDPAHLHSNPLAPPVHITAIIADRKPYPPQSELRVPPLAREIEIEYTALSYVVPQKVLFRYMLEGYDSSWHDPGTRRQAFYNDLPPGRYHFRVIACNSDGVWNNEGASLDFAVAPAYYQTTWFRALCLGAVAALLWLAYRLRLRQMQRRFAVGLEAQVGERVRIARELHDTLLQSFQGAVFQFQAARKLLLRNADNAMQAVNEAIHAAEEGITEGRAAIRDLRPESIAQRDLPELLDAAGRELADSHAFDGPAPSYRVTIEGKQRNLAPLLQDEIYRIARELIRNAYSHAAAGHIEVEVRYERDQFRLRVRDDGKGIDPGILQAGGQSGHWGIRGMRERTQQIGAGLEFWSRIGAGTEAQLTVPASRAYDRRDGRRFPFFRKADKDGQHS